jgi:hypothetical protein
MTSSNLHDLLLAEIRSIDTQIMGLQEKRRQLQATVRLYAPAEPSQSSLVLEAPSSYRPAPPPQVEEGRRKREEFLQRVEANLSPSGLKREIIQVLMKIGPATVPMIQQILAAPHQPSIFRAVRHLVELGLVYVDEATRKVHLKLEK